MAAALRPDICSRLAQLAAQLGGQLGEAILDF